MEKTRRHLFYPISLLPQKEKQNQKEKVLLCACVDMMLTDKTFFFFFMQATQFFGVIVQVVQC